MAEEPELPAIPEEEPPAPAQEFPTFTLVERRLREVKWTLTLRHETLTFECPGEMIVLDRKQATEDLDLHLFGLRQVTVLLRHPGGNQHFFTPEPEVIDALQGWLGPLTADDLRVVLGKRVWWMVPLGILFLVASLTPLQQQPPQDIHPLLCGLGVALLVTRAVAWLFPRRIFFLLGALYYCTIAAELIREMIAGRRSYFWLIPIWFLLVSINDWIWQFRRFAPWPEEEPADPLADVRRPGA